MSFAWHWALRRMMHWHAVVCESSGAPVPRLSGRVSVEGCMAHDVADMRWRECLTLDVVGGPLLACNDRAVLRAVLRALVPRVARPTA